MRYCELFYFISGASASIQDFTGNWNLYRYTLCPRDFSENPLVVVAYMQELLDFISRNPMMSGLWVVLLVALIITYVRSAMSPIKSLQPQEATVWVNRGDGIFVDIRNQDEFKKGHIHGSKHLSMDKIKQIIIIPYNFHQI